MKSKLLLIILVFAMALLPIGVNAAGESTELTGSALYPQTHVLSCQGQFWGYQATIVGMRQHTPYNALGDGYIQFAGEMQIGEYRLPMTYGGYSTLAPYPGILQNGQQSNFFKVLDNTGGRMIIYEGQERLNAPAVWGAFVCAWQAYTPAPKNSGNNGSQRGSESYYGEYGNVLRDENCTFVVVDGESIGGCE